MKGYLRPSSELDRHANLAHLLRLLMSIDAMRAARRWSLSLADDDSNLGKHDTLFATVTMMGWAYEALCTIRKGNNDRWLNRHLIAGDQELEAIWDKLVPKQASGSLLDKFATIRNQCAFHWDPGAPERCLSRLAKEKDEVAFVESDSGGDYLRTRYPIVYDAIAATIVDAKPGDANKATIRDEWAPLLREVGSIIGQVSKLASALASEMLKALPLKLEPDDE